MFSSRRALFILLVAAVASVPEVAAAASPGAPVCAPGLSISLLPQPGAPAQGRDATYVVADIAPGGVLHRRIRVCNGTNAMVSVEVYSNAAAIVNGAFLPVGTPRASNDLSRWTSVSPTGLTLRPQVPNDVVVEVAVPQDATPGERYAVIYAELPARPSSGGVAVASRVGVREYVLVTGPRPAHVDFQVQTLTAERAADGRAVVKAQVVNSGQRAIDLYGSLRLMHGPGGVSAGPYAVTVGSTLAPGQANPVQVLLDKAIPAGPWLARLELASGDTRRSAQATITFPSAGSASTPVKAKAVPLAKDRKVLIPVAAALIGLLFLLLLVMGLLSRRRRARGAQAR